MTWRKIVVPNSSLEFVSARRDEPFIFKPQPHSAQSQLEAGGSFIVANQCVCHPHGVTVQRAAERNTGLAVTNAPQVLHRCQKSRGPHQNIHAAKASNSSRETFRNRTRSPA